jgi:hypothetical protein
MENELSRVVDALPGLIRTAFANDGPGASFSFSIPRGPEDVMGAHNLGAIWTVAVADARHVMRKS